MSTITLNDRVLIKLDKSETLTEGGLHIPESAQSEEPTTGTVMAASDGVMTQNGKFHKPVLKKGDRVLVREYAGTEIKLNLEGEEKAYYVFRNADIFGIVVD